MQVYREHGISVWILVIIQLKALMSWYMSKEPQQQQTGSKKAAHNRSAQEHCSSQPQLPTEADRANQAEKITYYTLKINSSLLNSCTLRQHLMKLSILMFNECLRKVFLTWDIPNTAVHAPDLFLSSSEVHSPTFYTKKIQSSTFTLLSSVPSGVSADSQPFLLPIR